MKKRLVRVCWILFVVSTAVMLSSIMSVAIAVGYGVALGWPLESYAWFLDSALLVTVTTLPVFAVSAICCVTIG